jgi:prolyl-tRNA synthetase
MCYCYALQIKNDPDKPGKLMVDPNAKLEEELIVRPTSEAIIWSTYKGCAIV